MNRRNIGVLAHVDTGKTTLCERLLQHCGAIRTVGSVDAGTAHTDRLAVEKRRGISVKAACAPMLWKGVEINLIDTPGHADFAAEVERSLWALDGVVLLLDAVDGVMPRAEQLFSVLKSMRMPTLLFINKCDRDTADIPRVMRQAAALPGARIADLSSDEALMETLAESDERAMEDYLSGHVWPHDALLHACAPLVSQCALTPVLCGSALRDSGIDALLDAMIDLLPPPAVTGESALCAVAFGVEMDKTMGRAAMCRVFCGEISGRMQIGNEKVTLVRKPTADGRLKDAGVLRAGDIGVIYGLSSVKTGDVLGDASLLPRRIEKGALCEAMLLVSVVCDGAAKPALRAALDILSVEDGHFTHEELQGVEHIRVMGMIQIEIIGEQLDTRFGLHVTFGEPTVVYHETIAKPAVGFYAYTMPKPCWAVIEFTIEPLARGSGVQFDSVVPVRDIMERYQHQVAQAIPLAVRQGRLGWPVDDVRITLSAGEHHLIHTHPLDFILCTPIALHDGLRRGGSVLLEPMVRMDITVPGGDMGRVTGDVRAMEGETLSVENAGDRCRVIARAPLRTCMRYPVTLAAQTHGAGALTLSPDGYREAPEGLEAVCPRKGVDPLDTAKYILAARSALDGGIFEG